MNAIRPSTPDGVAAAVTSLVEARPGRVRVAIDGAAASAPDVLAERVLASLPSRPGVHVPARFFWRQAALRLEEGHENPETWLDGWLDEGALRREVLDRLVMRGSVLPGLRDPLSDRALRRDPIDLPENGVVLVSGAVLLGRGLPFDVAVHLHMSASALARRTPADEAWTLSAVERYETERAPDDSADLVVRLDDPAHPALVDPRPRA